ncbi:CRISPR-associated helicase/endonuclease Cas3 [Corynebacterium diphtheriae]|nr:CRISPR-associated helicase/endonuclease Cas3 [Corynebacterium diphtheriae]
MSVVDQADQWRRARSVQSYSLWAKSGSEDLYLRLSQHLIDAACVAEWLWNNWVSDSLKSTLSTAWRLPAEEVGRLYIFYAGTHDVGKATISFQRLVEKTSHGNYLLGPVREAGLSLQWTLNEGEGKKFPHGMASALIIAAWLEKHDIDPSSAARLSFIADAHHGFASDEELYRSHEDTLDYYPPEWLVVHAEILDSMAEITDIGETLEELVDQSTPSAPAMQIMTGLVIMADWIASDEKAFPYVCDSSQHDRVAEGMSHVNLPPAWVPTDVPDNVETLFRDTFTWPDSYQVRPVQRAAVAVARAVQDPTIIIIEAPTGEGKTEAGLATSHILGQKTGAQGIFFAAPTMSTANGLFERTKNWAQCTSSRGEVASLYLAHSKNKLSLPFQSLRFTSIGEDDHLEKHGSVVASQWLSGRYRGILSDFVVGTVDQVLMMALQVRFSMLRHVGLAGKIVIIDEVHAYDAYMSQYLYLTLQWLAKYGVSVILMSATLPPQQRARLVNAYASQVCKKADVSALNSDAYPLITAVNKKGISVTEVPQENSDTMIKIRRIDDSLPALGSMFSDLLVGGGIALVICNTIRRAQQAYDSLKEIFPDEVELHHAAFIATQRSEKEDALRESLGPHASRGEDRPWRRIVVATQVAEQSLDIDADVLVTDIAPIDLIIQRAGRLHRHERPHSDRPEILEHPQIFIRGINNEEISGEVPEFDGGAAAIYGEKILYATVAYLPDEFHRPSDIPKLVKNVYSDTPCIPENWKEQWEQACVKAKENYEKSVRKAQTFSFPQPHMARTLRDLFKQQHSNSVDKNEESGSAQVRDAEFSIEVVALLKTEYGYHPFGREEEIENGRELTWKEAEALAGNTVRLPAQMTRRDSDFNAVIDSLEAQTPPEWQRSGLLKGQVALLFDERGEARVGRFLVRYTNERGLEVEVCPKEDA